MKKFFKNFYLLLIFLFLYAPIVVLMIFSFNDSKSRRLWNGFTTRWYVELFRDADILHSLYVTLLVAVAAAAIATVLGTIAAIGIHNMGRRAKAAYLTVNNIPMSSSDTIMGVTFMLLFAAIGLDKGYLTLILAHVTFCTPYVVLNVMPKLRQLDKNAYEAALDLGATPHQALARSSCRRLCRASSRALSWRSPCQSTILWSPTLPPARPVSRCQSLSTP